MQIPRLAAAAVLGLCSCVHGAVIGQNTPAPSLTAERVAALPLAERAGWMGYLERSRRQERADRAALNAELKAAGLAQALVPPNGSARAMPLNRPPEWYAGAEARRIADIVLSFQTPAGGWSKNLNLGDHARRKGESFAPDNLSKHLDPADFDAPRDPQWNYMATIDNDGTTSELLFLAKVATAVPERGAARYRSAFLRGLEYLFAAQFPNGGWPQVWPLEGGYHDAITFNDGAVTRVIDLMERVAEGKGEFAFVPSATRRRARASVERGLRCILACRIAENGGPSVWGQQHDALTLRPVAGRNYEPPALSSGESAGLMLFLMSLPDRTPEIESAIHSAAQWFVKTAVHDKVYLRGPDDRRLADKPGAPSLWARFYEIDSDRPVFGDRDKSIHDELSELSLERRTGYAWYTNAPQRALARYEEWKVNRPAASTSSDRD